eukprot:TRINITY_DN2007_c0_g1_i1.p1 TRINITY_DN2007_c0_g1~~TRINITY_DN2007_c0_g1_i1.p1  ORF type:complete len:218 (-),score=55.28 TRINITY_DN2007_c0_g1_i1:12-665(-)
MYFRKTNSTHISYLSTRTKMVVVLSKKHKQDLQFLIEVDEVILKEFARISVEFLRNGSNPKMLPAAAKKLGVSAGVVQGAVQGLSFVFAESARQNCSDIEFHETLLVLQFPEDLNQSLTELYLLHKKEMRKVLNELTFTLPHYENMNWRLDIQIASRTLNKQMTPIYTLKFEIATPNGPRYETLQVDYANLQHLTLEIDNALKELKSTHCRRIMRNV